MQRLETKRNENTKMSKIGAYLVTSRMEYIPGEIPAIFVILFITASGGSLPLGVRTFEALGVFGLLYFTGFMINALADYEIDKKYSTFKSGIPLAVETLGVRSLTALIALQTLVACLISIHISFMLSSPVPIALVLLGVLTGLGYSIKPFRFKERGILHGIALGLSAFFLPPVFLIYSITGSITPAIVFFFGGFTAVHYGMEFGNQAIDYKEDREQGVLTPPVRWGLTRSLAVGVGLMVVGMAMEISGLFFVFQQKVGYLTRQTFYVLYTAAAVSITGGYLFPLKKYLQMWDASRKFSVDGAIERMKELCKYAKWQASGILGVFFATLILFSAEMYIHPHAYVSPSGTDSTFRAEFLDVNITYTPLDETTSTTNATEDPGSFSGMYAIKYTILLAGIAPGPDKKVLLRAFTSRSGEVLDSREIEVFPAPAPDDTGKDNVTTGKQQVSGQQWSQTLSGSFDMLGDREETTRIYLDLAEISVNDASNGTGAIKVLDSHTVQPSLPVYLDHLSISYVSTSENQLFSQYNVTAFVYCDRGNYFPDTLEVYFYCSNQSGSEFLSKEVVLDTVLTGGGWWTPSASFTISATNLFVENGIVFEAKLVNATSGETLEVCSYTLQ